MNFNFYNDMVELLQVYLCTYHIHICCVCRLETKILACSIWPVEIIRLSMPTPGKGGKSTKVEFAIT